MIEILSLYFNYNGTSVLKGVDLILRRGENLILSGPSGTGKTTLVKLIAGLELPASGEIKIDGKVASAGNTIIVPPFRRSLGIVFQEPSLWPHMSTMEHLEFVAEKTKKTDTKERLWYLLKASGLDSLSDRLPGGLSAGQAQRLNIIRALAAQPHYLIMDEPFSNLDPETKKEMIKLIKGESEKLNAGLLLITHDEVEASMMEGKQYWLRDGNLWHDVAVGVSYNSSKPIASD